MHRKAESSYEIQLGTGRRNAQMGLVKADDALCGKDEQISHLKDANHHKNQAEKFSPIKKLSLKGFSPMKEISNPPSPSKGSDGDGTKVSLLNQAGDDPLENVAEGIEEQAEDGLTDSVASSEEGENQAEELVQDNDSIDAEIMKDISEYNKEEERKQIQNQSIQSNNSDLYQKSYQPSQESKSISPRIQMKVKANTSRNTGSLRQSKGHG